MPACGQSARPDWSDEHHASVPPHRRRHRSQQRHRRRHRPPPGRGRASTSSAPPAAPTGSRRWPTRSAARRSPATSPPTPTSPALGGRVGDRLDVLVNNAGGAFGAGPVAEADADDWRRMYEVNVIGLMQVTQALLPALVASRRGRDPQRRLDRRPDRLRGRRRLHRRQARHPGRHRDAAARALRPAGAGLRDRARAWCSTDEFALVRFDGDQEKADAVYAGVAEPLVAEDVADAITWMVTRPAHVNIDELVIQPRAQAAQHKVHRVTE